MRWVRKFSDNIALADKNSNASLVSVYAHVTQSRRNKLNLNEGGIGAGNETRTRDFHLGKVVLYQLSYARKNSIISIIPTEFKEIMGGA